ncbi:MAG: ATP-binding protein [Bacteroidales bacterium]|nr:ATP-binding protein [Bacteroidales bacterium]
MDRLFYNELKKWKDSAIRKPLILRGGRQVGKSYIVKQLGIMAFNGNLHIIDFERRPDWVGVFERNLDPKRILSELEMLLNKKINPGTDLLFFDEIQVAPKAIMSLRYFYEELPELHVIAAGSLLEFAMKDISFPVGRVQMLSMTPMNFYEFLVATGKEIAAEIILTEPGPLPDTSHIMMLESLRQYMFIGGMPECVEAWRNTNSMVEVFEIQSNLLETYRQDFSKYAPYTDKRSLNHVLNYIAVNIGRQVKYARLSDEFTGPTNKKAFDLLRLARLVYKVRAASMASLPLEASASESRFKAVLLDTGLMRALNDLPPKMEFVKNNLLSMYNGALAEQFVGQEFISSGMERLYYWSREAKSSSAEVDYMITRNGKICPVEIKSGPAGKLRSIHHLIQKYPDIDVGYVLSTAPYGRIPEQKLVFLPLYYAYSLTVV